MTLMAVLSLTSSAITGIGRRAGEEQGPTLRMARAISKIILSKEGRWLKLNKNRVYCS